MKLGSSLRRRRGRERGVGGSLKRAAIGLLIVALGFGGGYFLATEIFFPAPELPDELSRVPDLRGLDRGRAAEQVRNLGLILSDVDSVSHPTLPRGRVVGQSPVPGQMAAPGDSLRMTLSLGPEERPVPDVFRVRGDRAIAVLQATGFRVGVDSVESQRPRGMVLSLEPDPGTNVTLPGEVRVTISLGPPRVSMPLLLGLSDDEALSRLDSLGLAVSEVETRFRFELEEAMVIGQEPDPGTMVERGTAVRITVGSRGGTLGNIPPSGSVETPGIPGDSPREPSPVP